ncbi:MAG: 30S ribosomal protein S8 [Candidatus Omnitrophica bacterium]|nr:30S ribosomal protein S8 [Candidatus Omnitrophota bacterium]
MSQTDTIADFITRIRNASFAKKDTLECPLSNMRKSISEILKREGFIRDFRVMKDKRQGLLRIYLKYSAQKDKIPAITNLKRISKPGLRIYEKGADIPTILGGRGIALVSASKGVLTDTECREQNIGGEVLCYVW